MLARATRIAVLGALVAVACASPTNVAQGGTRTASVRCEPEGTWVQPEAVRARPDGVHLSIDNRTERRMFVYARIGEDIRPVAEVDIGSSDEVETAAPGAWGLVCVAVNAYPREQDPWATLQVVDPHRVWVSDILDCDRIAGSHPDYREDFEGGTPEGERGDPLELAREGITGAGFPVLPDDVLERAGYPDAGPLVVRVVRNGRVVAVGTYSADGRGGWIDRGAEYCELGSVPEGTEPAPAA
jgi:hypothetical protein